MVTLELIGLCALYFLMCYLGTGSDEKNIKSYSSYPDEVQKIVRSDSRLKLLAKTTPPAVVFFSNVLTFGILFFIMGLPIRSDSILLNFSKLSILGQGLNLFDFVVIDLLWWRNSPRVRFSGTEHMAELYRNPEKHAASYIRGVGAFFLVALLDGFLLTLL